MPFSLFRKRENKKPEPKPKKHDDYDKDWAKRYILDPLNAPEPNQDTGLSSSLVSPYKRLPTRREPTCQNYPSAHRPPASSTSPKQAQFILPSRPSSEAVWPPPGSPDEEGAELPFAAHHRYRSVPVTHASPAEWFRHTREALAQHQASQQQQQQPLGPPRRPSILAQRFAGDQTHRPLDMLKQEARKADRPHRHRKRISEVDTIDALDTVGGKYHHGGPYDATLTSRNMNPKYSPVAAVQDSNLEAIRATPREHVIDSLTFHVPLQGTATIPPGGLDMSGNVMEYNEGADLMREPDAAGGAYKRWDGIQYHPDDLKGKGDPSFTIERDLKKHRHRASEPGYGFELQSGVNRNLGRTRSSSASKASEHPSMDALVVGESSGLGRSSSTGKRLSSGLKRRFGSLRKKASA